MIVAITGHQAWPPPADAAIRAGIAAALASAAQPLIGATSLAAGADQLFARMVLQRGGTLRVVVPCARYPDAFSEPAALQEYKSLLALAASTEQLPYAAPPKKPTRKRATVWSTCATSWSRCGTVRLHAARVARAKWCSTRGNKGNP